MANQRHAILIGIDRNTRLLRNSFEQQLGGCTHDVQEMHRVLSHLGFAIHLLLDQLATRNDIVSAFEGLIKTVRADDTVVIYFAGRGSWIQADGWRGGCPTLVAHNSGREEDGGPNRDILIPELEAWVAEMAACQVSILLDASFSGVETVDDHANRSARPDRRREAAMRLDHKVKPVAASLIQRLQRGDEGLGSSATGWQPLPNSTATWLTAGDAGVVSEKPRHGIGHGAFSGALINILDHQAGQGREGHLPWRRIFAQLVAELPATEMPRLTGPTASAVGSAAPPAVGACSRPRRALLIGVNQYPNVAKEFGRSLYGTLNDLQRMHHVLTHYGFHSRILFNAYATRANILAAMKDLERDADQLQELVVHFSGHGARVIASTDRWRRTFHTLVPYDSGRGQRDGEELVNRDIFDSEIDLWIHKLNGRAPNLRPILVFDSCYAGGASRALEERSRSLRRADRRDTQAMFADGRPPADVMSGSAASRSRDIENPGGIATESIARGATGWLPYAERHALILAAAAESEWANETTILRADGSSFASGQFSFVLVEALEKRLATDWSDLPWEAVTDDVTGLTGKKTSYGQNPAVEGLRAPEPLVELDRHAVVIGINHYSANRDIRPLTTPVADAEELAKVLEVEQGYPPENIHLLTTQTVTPDQPSLATQAEHLQQVPDKKTLIALLDRLGKSETIKSDDALLFYFAGHGEAEGDAEGGFEGFLLPQDADIADSDTWLPMRELRQKLAAIDCRHQLIVLDCCFAGAFSFTRSGRLRRRLFRGQLQRYLQSSARQLLTSAAHNQLARDVSRRHHKTGRTHSPFAAALLEGLSGAADFVGDGIITATELHQYIERELIGVPGGQTPALSQLSPGHNSQFIFRHPGLPALPAEDPDLTNLETPWQGLESYGERHARLFFGRDQAIERLLALVDPAPPTPNREPSTPKTPARQTTLLAVIGASGCGKSSLVRAGLFPRLRRSGRWRIVELPRLGEDPASQLAMALEASEPKQDDDSPKASHRLLFIDQFEELFTNCPDQPAREELVRAIRQRMIAGDQVLITLRADFPHVITMFGETLRPLGESLLKFNVSAPSLTELREVIERPAQEVGLYLDEGLVAALIEDVRDALMPLPLLSFTLDQVYDRASPRWLEESDRELRAADYKAVGKVSGALQTRAEQLYIDASEDQRAALRRIFLRFFALESGHTTRRRVETRELTGIDTTTAVQQVLETWIDNRFLVMDAPYLELANDALIQTWNRLKDWLAESKELVMLLPDLWREAIAWDQAGAQGTSGQLWHHNPRLQVLREHGKNRPELNAIEDRFVDASFALLEQEREKERRQHRLNLVRKLAAQSLADLDRHLDRALLLSAQARRFQQSYALPDLIEIHKSLQCAVSHHRRLAFYLCGHDQPLETIAWSADRRQFASAGRDRKIVIWDMATRQQLGEPLLGHRNTITALAFSPADPWLLASGGEQDIALWDTRTGQLAGHLAFHQERVLDLAWSPDGKTLASSSGEGVIALWGDSSTPRTWLQSRSSGAVEAIAFSPDSQQLATAGLDGQLSLWDVNTGSPISHWQAHDSRVVSIAWRPDGVSLASAGLDGTILWDIKTRDKIAWFGGHDGWVMDIDWSPDGKVLASCSTDGEIFLWRGTPDGEWLPQLRLTGHDGIVSRVAFDPAEGVLVSAGWDRSVMVWGVDLKPPLVRKARSLDHKLASIAQSPVDESLLVVAPAAPEPILLTGDTEQRLAPGHQAGQIVFSVAINLRGDTLASGGSDGMILVWDLPSRTQQSRFEPHPAAVDDLAFSPDGALLASACAKHRVVISDLASGESREIEGSDGPRCVAWSPQGSLAVGLMGGEILVPKATGVLDRRRAHDSNVSALAFSPDGATLATASLGGRIQVWSVMPWSLLTSLSGHRGEVKGIAWRPDGKVLASCGADKTVRLWDPMTGASLGAPLLFHGDAVWDLAWTADGKTLISVGQDGLILFWDIDMASWLGTARDRANRNLSRDEWHRFVGDDIPYQRTFPELPPGPGVTA